MYFLSLETSTKTFSIAVNHDAQVLRYRNLKSTFILENALLPAMDRILKAAGIDFEKLDGFAIATGPGSFTSLRVGLAVVKAFALASAKPVIGIPTLDIIAEGLSQARSRLADHDEICVIADARRGKVYACFYQGNQTSVPLLTSLEDVLSKAQGRTLFTGDALSCCREAILKAYALKADSACSFAEERYWYPQARVMARLAHARFCAGNYDNAATLVPLYLYSQDCQVSHVAVV